MNWDELYKVGVNFYQDKNYEEAINYYNQALTISSENIDVLNAKGKALYELSKFEESINVFSESIRFKKSYKGYIGLSQNYLKKIEYMKAINFLILAINFNPNYLEAYQIIANSRQKITQFKIEYYLYINLENKSIQDYKNYSTIYYTMGKFKESLYYYDEYIKINSNKIDVYNAYIDKVKIYIELYKFKEAQDFLMKAFDINPINYLYWYYTAKICYLNDDLIQALDNINSASKIEKSVPEIYYLKGKILESSKRYKESIYNYELSLKLNSEQPLVLYKIGSCYQYLLDNKIANTFFIKATSCQGKSFEDYFGIAISFLLLGNYKMSIHYIKESIEIKDFDPELWYNYGLVLFYSKSYKDSIEKLQKAVLQRDYFPEALNKIGDCHLQLNNFDESLEYYNKAIKQFPEYPQALNNRGYIYFKLKQYNKAEIDYNESILLKPDYALPFYNKGMLMIKQDKIDLSIKYFIKSIIFDPTFAEAYYWKGKMLYQKNRYSEALQDLDYAIEANPSNPEYYYMKGIICNDYKLFAQAIESFDYSLNIRNYDVAALFEKAHAQVQLGHKSDAIETYDEILKIDDKNSQVHLRKSLLNKQLGNVNEASSEFVRTVLNLDLQ